MENHPARCGDYRKGFLHGTPSPHRHGNPVRLTCIHGVFPYVQETGVIHMAANIALLLDRAKVVHSLSSDYKLALVLGVDQKSLRNYRQGITLPDARVIRLICDLTGDDAALLAVQIEESRAKSDEARALWHQVAERMQAAATTAVFAVAFLVAGMVGFPMGDAHAQASRADFISYTSWNVAKWGIARLFRALMSPAVRYLGAFFTGGYRVPRAASIAAA